jgi:uncharacterized repeat protein (TIGR01451 family)
VAGPATEDVQFIADFSITKTAAASAAPNTTFSYTLTPRNNGRAVASQTFSINQATDVTTANVPSVLGSNPLTVTDTLPSGVSMTSGAMTGTGWTCTGTPIIVCTLANANAYPVAPATDFASISGNATMTVTCSAAPTGQTNTAQISAAVGETVSANNTASAVTSVACATANLSVSKTNGASAVSAGTTTTYTLTFVNAGPGAADGAVVADSASAGQQCASVTCTQTLGGASCPSGLALGTPVAVGSTAFFGAGTAISSFPANSTVTLTVACGVTATGQ